MKNRKQHFNTLARHIDWRDAIERQTRKQPQHPSVADLTAFNQERAAKRGVDATGTITLPSAMFRAGAADNFQAGSGDGSGFVGSIQAAAFSGLRQADLLDELGVNRLSSPGANINVPVFLAGAVSTSGEVASATAPGLESETVSLSPKRAQASVTFSNELLQQSSNEALQRTIDELQRMTALEVQEEAFTAICTAALDASSDSTTDTSAAVTYDILRSLEEGAIRNGADARSIKVVASTGAGEAISDLERTTAPVIHYPSRTVFGYSYYVSKSLAEPEDTNAGGDPLPTLPRVIVGDFTQGLLVADFGAVDVTIDPYSAAGTGQTKLTVTSYYDVAVANDAAFSVYSKAATP
jgi:HK97 family phage major capsid protein